jgi:hypothetical protein
MAEQLSKLRPDRDLQCYFFEPSAVAAISQAHGPDSGQPGFTVSGCWRQQFDWAVVEWNRDNVFEHPAFRNLPDSDLSGVHLSYQETRSNCIPMDSTLYPTVDWPYLRIWANVSGAEIIYRVPLIRYATPVDGYTPATAELELKGTPTAGDYIELAWLEQHFNYQISAGDTLETAAEALAAIITANQIAGQMSASTDGSRITLTYAGMPGSNGNRVGVYGTVHGAGTESWLGDNGSAAAMLRGGVSPQTWRVSLNFANLADANGTTIPASNLRNVRKLRWTWAADQQQGTFERTEFSVVIANWNVTGTNLTYSVAGPGSRRIEDDNTAVTYTGSWSEERGNYSGGSIHLGTVPGSQIRCTYSAATTHLLYLGTRLLDGGAQLTVQVDSNPVISLKSNLVGEDVLARVPVGQVAGNGPHSVTITHSGPAGSTLYFDFLEIALTSTGLPAFDPMPITSLATDWDTNHSLALAPERTAWLINALGFRGRENHYAGALWFYELRCVGNQCASATVTFAGTPEFGKTTEVQLGPTSIDHVNLIGDTAESTAKCFELLINAGSTGVWACSEGTVLTVTSRAMGTAGQTLGIAASTNSQAFSAQVSSATLSGGVDGKWITDINASPRLNRAARDWSRSFFQALKSYGIPVTTSFSMELGNGDDSPDTDIAQRYPDGSPAWLNTPALQTNFGPASTVFWREVYAEMAGIMAAAGIPPYLQFGEVQWWYFAGPATQPSGMPFYDGNTTAAFQSTYGRPMAIIPSQNANPNQYGAECAFLPGLIGAFTNAVISYVRQSQPGTRFEVLYPPDVNDTPLNRIINFPSSSWTAANLACLKTENFTYTGDRNLDQARGSIQLPGDLGFLGAQSSHLVGIGDYTTPWLKEHSLAIAAGVESVVLFALDQFCLIGYRLPLAAEDSRSQFFGG